MVNVVMGENLKKQSLTIDAYGNVREGTPFSDPNLGHNLGGDRSPNRTQEDAGETEEAKNQ